MTLALKSNNNTIVFIIKLVIAENLHIQINKTYDCKNHQKYTITSHLYETIVCYTKLDTDLNFNDQQKDLCTFLFLNIVIGKQVIINSVLGFGDKSKLEI